MIRFEVKGLDELIRKTQKLSGLIDRAANSALASIGYRLKQEAKTAVQGNTLGWPQLSYPTQILRTARPDPNYVPVSRSERKFLKTMGVKDTSSYIKYRRTTNPGKLRMWGQLGSLVSYKVEKGQGFVTFGFMSGTFGRKTIKRENSRGEVRTYRSKNFIGNSIRNIVLKLTEGSSITVTRDMQRFLAGLGFFHRIGSTMKIPERPLVVPVFERMRGSIPGLFSEKFNERLSSYVRE